MKKKRTAGELKEFEKLEIANAFGKKVEKISIQLGIPERKVSDYIRRHLNKKAVESVKGRKVVKAFKKWMGNFLTYPDELIRLAVGEYLSTSAKSFYSF